MRLAYLVLVFAMNLLCALLAKQSLDVGNGGMAVVFCVNWLASVLWLIWARQREAAEG